MKDAFHFFASYELQRPEPREQRRARVPGEPRAAGRARASSSPSSATSTSPFRSNLAFGKALLAGRCVGRRRHERLLPQGARDPRLRRPDERLERQRHRERRLERAGQELAGQQLLPVRHHGVLQQLPLESRSPANPDIIGQNYENVAPDRRRKQPPGLRPEALHRPRGLQRAEPEGRSAITSSRWARTST